MAGLLDDDDAIEQEGRGRERWMDSGSRFSCARPRTSSPTI